MPEFDALIKFFASGGGSVGIGGMVLGVVLIFYRKEHQAHTDAIAEYAKRLEENADQWRDDRRTFIQIFQTQAEVQNRLIQSINANTEAVTWLVRNSGGEDVHKRR